MVVNPQAGPGRDRVQRVPLVLCWVSILVAEKPFMDDKSWCLLFGSGLNNLNGLFSLNNSVK